MSDETNNYVANSMRLYDIDGELFASICTQSGEHLKIKFGIAQARSMNADSADFIASYYARQEAEDSEFKAMFSGK